MDTDVKYILLFIACIIFYEQFAKIRSKFKVINPQSINILYCIMAVSSSDSRHFSNQTRLL